MYQRDAEMLFPSRVIPQLGGLRGTRWRHLVDAVSCRPDGELDSLAFGLMMVRLGNCMSCHADSYRAMRGCTACARQTIVRFRDEDDALIDLYRQARRDVDDYLRRGKGVSG